MKAEQTVQWGVQGGWLRSGGEAVVVGGVATLKLSAKSNLNAPLNLGGKRNRRAVAPSLHAALI